MAAPSRYPACRLLVAALALFLAAGCGKKGVLVPPEALVPATIGNLTVAQKGERFQVSWSAPGRQEGGAPLRDLTGFLLYRRVLLPPAEDCDQCPDAYRQLARVDLDYPRGVRQEGGFFLYDDADLTGGKSYQYKVRSFSAEGGLSSDSNRARHAVLVPPSPPVLEALSGPTGVVLAFVGLPPSRGTFAGYNVYRAKKGNGMPLSPLNAAPVTGTTYQDRLQLVGIPWDYWVTCVAVQNGETVESAPSNLARGEMLLRE